MTTKLALSTSPGMARYTVATVFASYANVCRERRVARPIEDDEIKIAVETLEDRMLEDGTFASGWEPRSSLGKLEVYSKRVAVLARIMLADPPRFASTNGHAQMRALAAVTEVLAESVAGLTRFAVTHEKELPRLEGAIFSTDNDWADLTERLRAAAMGQKLC